MIEGTVYGVCLLRVAVGFGEVELRERKREKQGDREKRKADRV